MHCPCPPYACLEAAWEELPEGIVAMLKHPTKQPLPQRCSTVNVLSGEVLASSRKIPRWRVAAIGPQTLCSAVCTLSLEALTQRGQVAGTEERSPGSERSRGCQPGSRGVLATPPGAPGSDTPDSQEGKSAVAVSPSCFPAWPGLRCHGDCSRRTEDEAACLRGSNSNFGGGGGGLAMSSGVDHLACHGRKPR